MNPETLKRLRALSLWGTDGFVMVDAKDLRELVDAYEHATADSSFLWDPHGLLPETD